ncbi:hypothetical protein [Dactylosporangium sp. CA-139066]|uniref:hypothetical protein n=1 Tax=Dactylosporangium sp. CA-139066 TaxID=3239930 RepID=UPI003D90556F
MHVLTLPEQDYLYGSGPLRLRVEHVDVDRPFAYDGEDWYGVSGVQLDHAGADLHAVQVLVRGRRIPAALRT